MSYGLKNTDIGLIVYVLSQFPEIEKVILYGPRAKGNYNPASDVDLTLVGKKLNPIVLNKVWGKLENLALPYRFDLSLYDRIPNYNLVDHIDETGVKIYRKR